MTWMSFLITLEVDVRSAYTSEGLNDENDLARLSRGSSRRSTSPERDAIMKFENKLNIPTTYSIN